MLKFISRRKGDPKDERNEQINCFSTQQLSLQNKTQKRRVNNQNKLASDEDFSNIQNDKNPRISQPVKQLEDEDTIGCRICLEEDEDKITGQIGNFCSCKGSISMVHVNCLEIQLQMKFKDQSKLETEFQNKCELCQADYKLNISKRVCLNSFPYISKKFSQKTKILCFLLFISLFSLQTSYSINKQMKEYLDISTTPIQSINIKPDEMDIQWTSMYFDLNYLISGDAKAKEILTDNKEQRDSIQVTLGYMFIGFFFTTGFLSLIMFTYNILSFFLYLNVYISKKNLKKIK